jgi:hypothetical protein
MKEVNIMESEKGNPSTKRVFDLDEGDKLVQTSFSLPAIYLKKMGEKGLNKGISKGASLRKT